MSDPELTATVEIQHNDDTYTGTVKLEPTPPVGTGSTISDSTKLEQAFASSRHYSALRFAVLTVLVATTSALGEAWIDRDKIGKHGPTIICIGGIVVAAVFLVFQVRIAMVIANFDKRIKNLLPAGDNLAGTKYRVAATVGIAAATGILNVLAIVMWSILLGTK